MLAFLVLAPAVLYQAVYADKVFLGVNVMGQDIGGYSPEEAKAIISSQFSKYAQTEVVLRDGSKEWRTTPSALGARLDAEATIRQAMAVGRGGGLGQLVEQFSILRSGHSVAPVVTFDQERQRAVLTALAKEINRPMVNASLVVRPEGEVDMVASQVGRKLDLEATMARVAAVLAGMSETQIELPVVETQPRVVEEQLNAAKETAMMILSGPLTVFYGDRSATLDREDLTAMLTFRDENGRSVAELDWGMLTAFVTEMAESINQEPVDARLKFVDGSIQVLSDSKDGLTVDVPASVEAISQRAMSTTDRRVQLVVEVQQPKVRSQDVAGLHLPDKLATAVTSDGDTGAERRHNVRLAVSRLNGVVVAPGDTYSFNKALGPTRLADGYKMGWGIIGTGDGQHETVPSEAGGICQVATTLFHAAFWSGLKIDQRTEHLYWIPRYGKPPLGLTGLDATVDGSGSPDTLDFKFTNNTGNYIAIESGYDTNDIYFTIWGVKPNWTVEVHDPVITNVVPADKTLVRILDESLAPGQRVWTEVAQDGFDVSIRRIVREGNRVIDDLTVSSHYRPARNVERYGPPLPGTTPTPGASTPSPEGTASPAPETPVPGADSPTPAGEATPTPEQAQPSATPEGGEQAPTPETPTPPPGENNSP